MFSSCLGAAYGGFAAWYWHLDWGPAVLGGALTTAGGLLPDLDSDSGVPVRELFSAAATLLPLLLVPQLREYGFSMEQALALMAGAYVLVRYGLSALFKRWTVHRGMFHSLPAMLIAGLAMYLLYHSSDPMVRVYLAGGVALGFMSHLVLDEIYSVDFNGIQVKLNQFAGSALKLGSKSFLATGFTYLLLGGLIYLAMLDWARRNDPDAPRANFTVQHINVGNGKF
jgi:hypothetical protein